VVKISEKRHGLGSEHPLCDKIQLIMIILFLIVWGIDSLSFFIFRYSTVLVDVISFPALLLPSFASLGFGLYLKQFSMKHLFNLNFLIQGFTLGSGIPCILESYCSVWRSSLPVHLCFRSEFWLYSSSSTTK